MTQIQNPKHAQDIEKRTYKTVLVIGYWPATSSVESNLEFVCNLLARHLSGGVLDI